MEDYNFVQVINEQDKLISRFKYLSFSTVQGFYTHACLLSRYCLCRYGRLTSTEAYPSYSVRMSRKIIVFSFIHYKVNSKIIKLQIGSLENQEQKYISFQYPIHYKRLQFDEIMLIEAPCYSRYGTIQIPPRSKAACGKNFIQW